MSGSIEESKLSDRQLNRSSGNNKQQWEERFADEMVNIIESFPEKEILIDVLKEFVQDGKVPAQGLQVANLVNSITNDITGSKLYEADKKSLNDDFTRFRGLLPESGNWIDVKVSGGAYPRYQFITSCFFETKSKRQRKEFDDIRNQTQRLSDEITKIKKDIAKITNEKTSLGQFLSTDLEIKSKQNQIIEKTSKEIDQLNLIHQNEKEELAKLNAERQAEKTKISEALEKIEADLKKIENDSQEMISQTKAQRSSHFNATRNIATKKKKVEALYNMEEKLGPVQEEIKKYSQSIKEGEESLKKLMPELDARLAEYNRFAEELNGHLQNQEIQNLKRNLEQENTRVKEIKEKKIPLREELNALKEEVVKIRNQSSVVDLDKSLQKQNVEIQKWKEVQTKNIQTQDKLDKKVKKQKDGIAQLEKDIEILLEDELLEEQSLQTLQQKSGEKLQFLERETIDFKIYEKNSLSAQRNMDEQIRQCDWSGIEKPSGFKSSFLYTLFITIICSLFCVILYNLPQGTLYKLLEI